MQQGGFFGKAGLACLVALAVVVLLTHSALAAGIRLVPSADRVVPGEDFSVDVVADGLPAEGLGAVQFRLQVAAPGSTVVGVPDLEQAGHEAVAVASPLLISAPTATRSGLGDLFLAPHQSGSGLLVLDNETLKNGSALYTYAHTSGAALPSGSGSLARFRVRSGKSVGAEQILFSLTEVMLLDGGTTYSLDYNQGAVVTLRCTVQAPNLVGLTLAEAQAALAAAGLTAGSVYELSNPAGARPLNVVLEQSAAAGSLLDCEAAVNLAINTAPAEPSQVQGIDKAGDDTGRVALSWTPSTSADVAGYRIYLGTTRLAELIHPQSSAEVGGLANGVTQQLRLAAYDTFGNESAGVLVSVTPQDDVPPVVAVTGVEDTRYYSTPIMPQVSVIDTHLDGWTATLNGTPYDFAPVSMDGNYTLVVTARDLSANETVLSLSFTVDRSAPEITFINLVEGGFYNTDLMPEVTIIDPHLVVEGTTYALNGQPYAPGTPVTMEGHYSLAVTARDQAGNNSALTLNFDIDRTVPVITVEGVEENAWYNVDVTPTVAIAEAHLLVSAITLDDQPFVSATPVGSEGHHALGITAEDRAGNTSSVTVFFGIDKTSPSVVTSIAPFLLINGQGFTTSAGNITLSAEDSGPAPSGVVRIDYRLDESAEWMTYIDPVSLSSLSDGGHALSVRAIDAAGNLSEGEVLLFQLDDSAPQTEIALGTPSYQTADGTIFVTSATVFTMAATDVHAGVEISEFRLDGGEWNLYTPFTVSGEGEHVIEFRSRDTLGNMEEAQFLSVIVDDTPPVTGISLNHQSYPAGENILVSADTEIALQATDDLSGPQTIFYRFDDETNWRTYHGAFRLTDLDEGSHVVRYRGMDNVGNIESERSATLVRLGVEVATEILDLPRVLVWTGDPAKITGKDRPAYTLDDISGLVSEALESNDIYFRLVTDKELFRREFRSGIYNQVMILAQDVPFDAVFLRELREAVHRGTGLLVSHWGNSVHPILQDLFGVDFKGSLAMSVAERSLLLFDGPISPSPSLTAHGRVLKTRLDGGTLAGIIPGESTCTGLRALDLNYPAEVRPGDRVTVTLSTPQGKKLNLVDEEQLTADTLPAGPVNRFTGHAAGDLAVTQVTATGVSIRLAASFSYLGESYALSVLIEGSDGRRITTGAVPLNPACDANLRPGMLLGPFAVGAIDEDRTRTSEDLPAVVLNRYGEGRTAFLAYDLLGSAHGGSRGGHLELLRQAANHLLPEIDDPAAGSVLLLETRVRLQGTGLELLAVETLGEGLTHLPLFGLTRTPLEYRLLLEDGEEASYRYFARVADAAGEFEKKTGISIGLTEGWAYFGRYPFAFAVGSDSRTLLQQALAWLEGQLPLHPEIAKELGDVRDQLTLIGNLPVLSPADAEKRIDLTVQAIHDLQQLKIDIGELHQLLDDYLRIIEGEAVLSI